MPDQEKLKEEPSNQLHQHVVVAKLFDESEEAYRLRCFTELHMKLPSDTRQGLLNSYNRLENNCNQCYPCNTIATGSLVPGTIISGICEGFGQQVAQQIPEGIVGGSEESSLTLEFFK
ncbi:hypothetical protein OIU74_009762, partial [Salix koriyanagi]